MIKQTKPSCCEQAPVPINRSHLPLSCPLPGQVMWNAHPRQYLPIEESGREQCPYCGTVYVLVEEERHK